MSLGRFPGSNRTEEECLHQQEGGGGGGEMSGDAEVKTDIPALLSAAFGKKGRTCEKEV